MAKQRVVKTSFWSDEYISELTPVQKLIYLYLFTNDFIDLCGIYEIGHRRMAFETGMNELDIKDTLGKFESDGKIQIYENRVFVVNFIKNQANNPSVQKGVIRSFLSVPQYVLKAFGIDIKSNDEVIRRVSICPSQRKRILQRDKICTKCGISGSLSNELQIDHLLPVWLGGKNTDNNLRVLCRECNMDREKDSLSQDGAAYITLLNLTLPNLTSKEDVHFDKFWNVYPRKEAKLNAEKSFVKAMQFTDIQTILSGVENYCARIRKEKIDKQYIKLPATWLNQGCWTDENKIKVNTLAPPPKIEEIVEEMTLEQRQIARERLALAKESLISKTSLGILTKQGSQTESLGIIS